jgi:hypothetical protein
MVMFISDCHCDTCPGTVSPKSKDGQMVFGGTLCHCSCHKEKDIYKVLEKEIFDHFNVVHFHMVNKILAREAVTIIKKWLNNKRKENNQ